MEMRPPAIGADELESVLEWVASHGYAVPPDLDIDLCLDSMLVHIGHPDPHLRDDLIYMTWCEWICEQGLLAPSQLARVVTRLLDDSHLFFGIGERDATSVLTRSFSLLAVVQVLELHRKNGVLEPRVVDSVKSAVYRYLEREQDLRGYVGDAGWAHAAAHGADALAEIVQGGDFSPGEVPLVLASIEGLVKRGALLAHEEGERLATVVMLAAESMPDAIPVVTEWIDRLPALDGVGDSRAAYCARVSTKDLVRSLAFRVRHTGAAEILEPHLIAAERTLNRFV